MIKWNQSWQLPTQVVLASPLAARLVMRQQLWTGSGTAGNYSNAGGIEFAGEQTAGSVVDRSHRTQHPSCDEWLGTASHY